jgi:uncharacterized membrane protein
MNEFLTRLERSLKHMSAEEKQDILQDYREHFEIGKASGKTEEQIAKALGEPEQLAKMFSAMGAAGRAHESRGIRASLRMIGAFLSFKVGGGILAAVLYFACLSAMVSLYAGAASIVLAGAGSLAVMAAEIIKGYPMWAVTAFFAALMLGSGGMLCCKGLAWVWRRLFGALPLVVKRMMQKSAGKKAIS